MSDSDLRAAGRVFAGGLSRLLVRDLVLSGETGAVDPESGPRARLRINLKLVVRAAEEPLGSDRRPFVCYNEIVAGIRRLAEAGPVTLVETLADRIARLCLADDRIRSARVRVERLGLYPDAASVGIEIERINPLP